MKKLFVFAITAALLAGCVKENSNDIAKDGDSLQIVASSGVAASTKKPIESGSGNLPMVAQKVYFARTADGTAADWTTVGTSEGNGYGAGIIGATLGTDGVVSFQEISSTAASPQFYNADGALKSYLLGFYPHPTTPGVGQATITGTQNSTTSTVEWTIDGKTDILFSDVVSGDKSNRQGSANIHLTPTFSHALTWLEFQIKSVDSDPTAAIAAWGKITEVDILNTDTKASFELAEGSTVDFNTSGTITSVKGDDGNTSAGQDLTADYTYYSQALLAPSAAVAGTYKLKVYTENKVDGYELEIDIPGGALAGYKHAVQLAFKTHEITATAKIEAWKPGNSSDDNLVD